MTTVDQLLGFDTPKYSNQENLAHARKKCLRCGQYYTDATNRMCYYHPGRYTEPNVLSGSMSGWSCCREAGKMGPKFFEFSILNEDAMQKNSKGCTKADFHTEDENYSKIISNFPFDLNAEKERENAKNIDTTPKPADSISEDDQFIYHPVQKEDTLMGISLKYNVPMVDIQRVNRLMGSQNIWHLKTIKIPKTKDSKATPLFMSPKNLTVDPLEGPIAEFQRVVGCSKEEASFYVSEAGGDVEMALIDYKADSEFAASNRMRKNKKKWL